MQKQSTKKRTIIAKERSLRAVELRIQGFTLQKIADQLGYRCTSAVHKAIMKELSTKVAQTATSINELRQLELERLDMLQLGLWERAISGDPQSISVMLNVLNRRSSLLGLDAPKVTETKITEIQITTWNETIKKFIDIIHDVFPDATSNTQLIEVVDKIDEYGALRFGDLYGQDHKN